MRNQKLVNILTVGTLATLTFGHPDPLPGYKIEEPLLYDTFPEDFMWGTATAAYQVNKCKYQTIYLAKL